MHVEMFESEKKPKPKKEFHFTGSKKSDRLLRRSGADEEQLPNPIIMNFSAYKVTPSTTVTMSPHAKLQHQRARQAEIQKAVLDAQAEEKRRAELERQEKQKALRTEYVERMRKLERPLWAQFVRDFEEKIGSYPNVRAILNCLVFPDERGSLKPQPPSGKQPRRPAAKDTPIPLQLMSWLKIYGAQHSVYGMCPVRHPETLNAFYHRYLESGGNTPIVALCHGTARKNAAGIVEHGLRVPGEVGVRVENGAACGVGIYTALQPIISMGYLHGDGVMFICAGMCMDIPEIRRSWSVHVYYRSEYVVPILALRFFRRKFHWDNGLGELTEEVKEYLRNPAPKVFDTLEELLAGEPIPYHPDTAEPDERPTGDAKKEKKCYIAGAGRSGRN
jgi:hypothetical protein